LFNCTIKENILLGCPEATDEEIIDALKKTNAWDFVSKNP
jgi:subfamily B ATP-binding cassette protein MsbA